MEGEIRSNVGAYSKERLKLDQMALESVAKSLLSDPLSEMTRKERRSLLATSMIGLVMVEGGLVPTRIQAIGVEFGQQDRANLLFLWGIVVLYFLVAFGLYAFSDIVSWYSEFLRIKQLVLLRRSGKLTAEEKEALVKEIAQKGEATEAFNLEHEIRKLEKSFAQPTSVVRMAFDFLLPIVLAVYTAGLLLSQ